MSSSTFDPKQNGLINSSEAVSFYVAESGNLPHKAGVGFPDVYKFQSTGAIDAGLKRLEITELSRFIFESELEESLKRLDELAELEHDWDSYGSEPPSDIALDVARIIARSVAEKAEMQTEGLAVPFFIAPLSGAGVQIEWRGPSASIEVEVGADGSLDYLIARCGGPERRFEERHGALLAELIDLICSIVQ